MQSTKSDRPSGQISLPDRNRDPARPTVTTIIQRELEDFDQRSQRRGRVVGRLIFLQTALLLMSAPLAIWPDFEPVSLGIMLVGLVIYGFAWVRNISGNVSQATGILLFGSALVTAVNAAGQIVWHPAQLLSVGLATFPFTLTILIAGLLYVPERVLLTAAATTSYTAILFFVSLQLGTELPAGETYLLAVMSMGLQALTGIIAWQISHFILDYSSELAQVRREEFIVTQYDALRRTMEEQNNRLKEQIIHLVQSLVALANRDYTVRASIIDGDLKPIADGINLLAGQLGAMVESEQSQMNVSNAAVQIVDLAGQIAEGNISGSMPQAVLATSTNTTGSLLNGAIMTLHKARQSLQQRLGHVRDLAIDAGQRMNQAEEQTHVAENALAENRATIGLLRSEAERVYTSSAELSQLIDKTLGVLSELLPQDVRAQARTQPRDASSTLELQQVMPGVTIQLDAITDDTVLGPADVMPQAGAMAGGSTGALADTDTQVRLREAWTLLIAMTEEVAKQVRDTNVLQEKLGMTSRSMRQVDGELFALRTAVQNVRQIAEQLYHVASKTTHPIAGTGALGASGQIPADALGPASQPYRTTPPSQPYRPTPSSPMPSLTPPPQGAPPAPDVQPQTPPEGLINAADLIDMPPGLRPPNSEE